MNVTLVISPDIEADEVERRRILAPAASSFNVDSHASLSYGRGLVTIVGAEETEMRTYFATAKQMARLDALAVQHGLEIRQMMELAGWHMLEVFRRLHIPLQAQVTVVCGKGNKAGDGLAAARHLTNHGWQTNVVLLATALAPDAAHHLTLLRKMRVPMASWPRQSGRAKGWLAQSPVLIDALIGYRLEGPPRGIFCDAVKLMNRWRRHEPVSAGTRRSGRRRARRLVIAYDIPTGVASDGRCFAPCIRADATLTLGLPKRAFRRQPARRYTGKIFLADIGIPDFVYDRITPRSRPLFGYGAGSLLAI